jgi:hypothetical protein
MKLFTYKKSLVFLFAVLFSVLFYKKLFGVNLLIFETVSISLGIVLFKPKFGSTFSKLLVLGTVITCLMVVLHNSRIAKVVNVFSYLLLIGSISMPNFQLAKNFIIQFVENSIKSTGVFLKSLINGKGKGSRFFHYLKIIGIPLMLILFFLFIYYNSNDYFSQIVDSFINSSMSFFDWIPSISFFFVITFILGVIVSSSIVYNQVSKNLMQGESQLREQMERKRLPVHRTSFIALKNEYKSGVFLLIGLNLLLVVFNYSDITTVWFSYEWSGGFLKEFVHSGTYLLIISLLVSIVIVLYFFRGNLNFYKKNKLLKILTYIWMSQNLILVISLFIRNSIYIDHFALAYKRIGVFAFLIAVLIGIITILIKVKDKKSFIYIVKKNTISVYLIFMLLTLFNWDVIISKYNLNAYEKAFVEMNFIAELSDKALPYIDLDDEALNEMNRTQNSLFSFKSRGSYISTTSYKERVEYRILNFMEVYPKRSWLEWNYADYSAYRELTQE